MIYDHRLLLYFQTIAKHQSISKAAEMLYLSQSSLSKFLKTLESEVGVKLVDRRTVPLKLTPAGQHFLQYLEESSRLYDKAMLDISRLGNATAHKFVIGASSMISGMISNAFPEFHRCYPDIQLTLVENHSEDLIQLLARKKLDMAVLVRNGNELDGTERTFELLVSQPRLIVVSKKNPLAQLSNANNALDHPQYLDIHLLANQKLIAGRQGQKIYADITRMVKERKIPIHSFLETQSIETMVSFTLQDYGVSFIPAFYLRRFSHLQELVFFYSNHPELQWALTLEFCSHELTPPERRFTDIVKKVCQD